LTVAHNEKHSKKKEAKELARVDLPAIPTPDSAGRWSLSRREKAEDCCTPTAKP
jgi:hypothetical protein